MNKLLLLSLLLFASPALAQRSIADKSLDLYTEHLRQSERSDLTWQERCDHDRDGLVILKSYYAIWANELKPFDWLDHLKRRMKYVKDHCDPRGYPQR